MVHERPANPSGVYRADIDGLRAVAVLLVVGNHLRVQALAGGFVGVDVFLVLSGYLISTILLREMSAGTFTFRGFYERRFRRILPALLAMLLVTSVLAYKFLLPMELNDFAREALGALFSVSNVVLWHDAGYFTTEASHRVLLHTWSLGVEEQFYVVFPVVMLLVFRVARRHVKTALWVLTVVCFGLACWGMKADRSAAFYLAPFRAWELLLGGLLACGAVAAPKKMWSANAMSFVGLAMVLCAGLMYTDRTVFPGWTALLPCVGTGLLLLAGTHGETATGRVLSVAPLRWLGLISYSLYLWHWPVQLFQEFGNILVPDRTPLWVTRLAIFLASVVAAALSWRFVEQPFRVGPLRARRPLFAMSGAAFAAVLVISGALAHWGGFPPKWVVFRSVPFYDFAKATPRVDQTRFGECFVEANGFASGFKPASCLVSDPARKQFLVVGDSHAAHMYVGLRQTFPNVNLSLLAVAACAPAREDGPWEERGCERSQQYMLDYVRQHRPDTVILVGRWSEADLHHVGETTDALKAAGVNVAVVGPNVEFDEPLIRLVELSKREQDPGIFDRHRVLAPQKLDAEMARMAREEWGVRYISMYDDMCEPLVRADVLRPCAALTSDGAPIVYDTDHLSPQAAVQFAQAIRTRRELVGGEEAVPTGEAVAALSRRTANGQ